MTQSNNIPIGLLGAAAFLSAAGARVLDSLLHVIATDFAVSIPAVSVVVAAFTLPYGLSQLVLGPVGDRIGKLRLMLCALIGYTVTTGVCALAPDLGSLTVMRALAGAASAGLIPVGMAYIGDAVPYTTRQVTLSRFLTGIVFAQMMAGPIGGLFGEFVSWRGVFLVLSGLSATLTVLLALRLHDLPDRRNPDSRFSVGVYIALIQCGRRRALLSATLFEGALLAGSFPFVAPYLRERFDLPYAVIGLVLAVFGIGAYIYIRFASPMLSRLGERGLVTVGASVMSAGLAIGMSTTTWPAFVLVEFLLGLGYFMLHSVLQARATEMLPQARATATASFAFMLFLGQSVGALLMGFAIARVGYVAGFWIDAAAILALGLILRAMVRRPVTQAVAA